MASEKAGSSSKADGLSGESASNRSPQHDSDDDGAVETIRRYLAEKLGFCPAGKSDDTAPEKVLQLSLDGVAQYIKEGKCKNIITMAGAGISTSAGIPDFRSPGSGLYDNLQKYNLPDPQAIFEIGFFRQDPQPFFDLAKELYPGSFKPTVCHYFIRLLHEKGLLLRHYTQNIDTLERVAGMPDDKLVEAHGTFHTSHCLNCREEYDLKWMKERIFSDSIPSCEKCNCIVKPDIVFFGENLPKKFFMNVEKDFPSCDLLIIMGSSLAVQPFASLIDRVPKNCPRLLVNREKAGKRDRLMILLGVDGGMEFDSDSNARDIAWLGDCDEGCLLLAEKLNWGDELRKLVEEEHAKLEKEQQEEAGKKVKEKKQDKEESSPKKQDEVKEKKYDKDSRSPKKEGKETE